MATYPFSVIGQALRLIPCSARDLLRAPRTGVCHNKYMSEIMSQRYELLYIIPTTMTEEEAGAVETRMSALITKYGGTVEVTKRLGKLHMAYPIKDQHHGYYVLTYFTADRDSLATIDTNLRIQTEILRYMTVSAPAGSDAKYDLVPFQEVIVETKEEKRAAKRKADAEAKESADSSDDTEKENDDASDKPAKKADKEEA